MTIIKLLKCTFNTLERDKMCNIKYIQNNMSYTSEMCIEYDQHFKIIKNEQLLLRN